MASTSPATSAVPAAVPAADAIIAEAAAGAAIIAGDVEIESEPPRLKRTGR